MRSLGPMRLVPLVMATPFLLSAAIGGGCGNDKPQPVVPTAKSSGSADAGPTSVAPPLPDAVQPTDAQDANDGNPWNVLLGGDAAPATDASGDAAPAACWKGFTPTGNADADVIDLGNRCAAGMSPVIPPVKHSFKTGEVKAVPVPFPPGCYRIIAVGGKGVKDVDLALKDNNGKVVAADMTPDDVFPMIHPNKEFCTEAFQILNLNIIVKKGTGEVAGGVWKR